MEELSTLPCELIAVKQLPVITEQLHALKAVIDERTAAVETLDCNPATLQEAKTTRADLNKQFNALEERRKAVKIAILEPYAAFEAVYKECVSDAYKRADAILRAKIDATAQEMKAETEKELREYFAELCASRGLYWLRYEDAPIQINLTEAQKKTHTGLKGKLREWVDKVSSDIELIAKLDDAPEILAEYKQTLNLTDALSRVQFRRERIEMEREFQERWAQEHRKTEEAVAKVDALAPPETVKKEDRVRCTFKVQATRTQLRELKAYMEREGIVYE